ncbi:hypothetical protein [Candidatus Poriferisodalis sp.]|uniref:hypothetical protein n=1 Tax=Candidatus Poriferisodalis sp. TaxID=3101277 RepID=UPI003B01E33A
MKRSLLTLTVLALLAMPVAAQDIQPVTPLEPAQGVHSGHIAVNVAGEQLGWSFTLPEGMTFDAQVQLYEVNDTMSGVDRVRSASVGLGYTRDFDMLSLVFAGHATYANDEFNPTAELRLEYDRYLVYAEYHFDPPDGVIDLAQECWEGVCVGVGIRF